MSYSKSNNNNHDDHHISIKPSEDDHVFDDEEAHREPHTCSALSCFMGTFCCCIGLCSCFTVQPNEEAVLLDYGKYNGTVKTPGCHFICTPGRVIKTTSTKVKSIMIPETKTIDKNGNPLVINGILTYQVRNAKRATLDVEYVDEFVRTQGLASMKQIVARYPYEAEAGQGLCLRSAADSISHEMVAMLQERMVVAGIKILGFTFNEISYAPEIAAGMLKRQQAQAIIQARKLIVTGAVDIAQLAVRELEANGIVMDASAKAKVASNLLTVICSESATAPVLPLSSA
eukprot:TRINITY_DN226_c0_g1_i1.p1 TRINITY_DN226_c0_g1~~TRINITY_DN226_c0_g1_i1.p1  ORF type:complete len:287 (+),score=84.57 TRINITY_DN226_c0_g1_i1:86-946(+)